jgi:hypothetical protein
MRCGDISVIYCTFAHIKRIISCRAGGLHAGLSNGPVTRKKPGGFRYAFSKLNQNLFLYSGLKTP